MSADLASSYPELVQLLGGYLNEDYDLRGPTLQDAVLAYRQDAAPAYVAATRICIARFMREHPNSLDAALDALDGNRAQEPGMSARDYLLWIDRILAEPEAAVQDHAAE